MLLTVDNLSFSVVISSKCWKNKMSIYVINGTSLINISVLYLYTIFDQSNCNDGFFACVILQRPKHVISSSDVTGNHLLHFFFYTIHFLKFVWHILARTQANSWINPPPHFTNNYWRDTFDYQIFYILDYVGLFSMATLWPLPWKHLVILYSLSYPQWFHVLYHKIIHFNTFFSSEVFSPLFPNQPWDRLFRKC
jgi:hypothetical protein